MSERPRSLLICDLAWPELRETLEAGYNAAIVPLGATEQHGPHLPCGADSIRAGALAVLLAAKLGGTLVAPTIPVGCSEEHRDFPGTLSLRHETLAALVVDVANSLVRQGFRRLIFISAHGGNARALAIALEELRRIHPKIGLWPPPDHSRAIRFDKALPRRLGVDPDEAGIHAGEQETSEMLALRPDLVLATRAESGYVGKMAAILPALQDGGIRPISPNGVLGDPRRACAERGQAYLTAIGDVVAEAVARSFAGE